MQTLAEIFESELTSLSRNRAGFVNDAELADVLYSILDNSENVEYSGVGKENSDSRDVESSFTLKDGSKLFVGNIHQNKWPVFFFTHGND